MSVQTYTFITHLYITHWIQLKYQFSPQKTVKYPVIQNVAHSRYNTMCLTSPKWSSLQTVRAGLMLDKGHKK